MEDQDIIKLFMTRSELALIALREKYSKYCSVIAFNILGNTEDAEEILNDTLFRVWNAIPPECPGNLRAFMGRITRNLSLDRYEKSKAIKRGGGQFVTILSELNDCIADKRNPFNELVETEAITTALNVFLSELNSEDRHLFIRRYWNADSIKAIAANTSMTVGNVKTKLSRLRIKLRKHLESEEIIL
ncbi:MAG: sigma-70 family RNA polymerase sigma factor [Oscillospiraceae bacterium]|jgi:RNA polymerase sigma-70 factor (ECF subfamily)|nr:sigma-70 family RNA polymerase sigma factor [Oscillospiraceae bacterium]